MPAPSPEAIHKSLSRLENGLPLHQKDFAHISWELGALPDPGPFLRQVKVSNQNLADTLVIFRQRLQAAVAIDVDPAPAISQAFLHYIVNTNGLIPELEGVDSFDLLDALSRYAESIGVGIGKQEDGAVWITVDDKTEPFPEWDATSGSSASLLRRLGPVANRLRYGRDAVIPSTAFGFDENAEGHAMANAMFLADCSHLAYFGPAFVEKQLRQWGYESFQWVEDLTTDTQVFVAGKGNHLIICFRGTSSGKDALVDTRFLKTKAFGGRGRVHRGFNGALDSVWPQLQAAVDALGAEKKLFVCGHSLGAALAQLAAHRLALGGYSVAAVYTYGSPRIGNNEFRDAYNELLEDKTFLHINNSDIVARIPPRILGFRHLGGGPRLFDKEHFLSLQPKPRALEDEGPEMDFEELDAATQEAILKEMQEAQAAMEASTQFLSAAPETMDAANARGLFEVRAVNDHSMDEYLYKFGAAIVDGEWDKIEGLE